MKEFVVVEREFMYM